MEVYANPRDDGRSANFGPARTPATMHTGAARPPVAEDERDRLVREAAWRRTFARLFRERHDRPSDVNPNHQHDERARGGEA